jgi:serine/threonine protein kinase
MHGNISAERTWVFTNEDLTVLLESQAHAKFLDAVYFTNTVVFIGISADDVAVSGRLIELRNSDLVTTPHYWITPDLHNRKRDWAENNGIRQIVYPSAQGHEKCVTAILDYVKSYKSTDTNVDKVFINARGATVSERDPVKLAGLDDLDQIRQGLNGLIRERMDDRGRISFDEYAEFCQRYRRAVANAYLLPENDGEKWFGYTVARIPLGGRTFGNVYSATSPTGELAAIKILQQKRFLESAYLSSFRRGAEALKILEQYRVQGVASLRESYELPPTLIMEFEIGTTLDEIIPTGNLQANVVLNIFGKCSSIVRVGHGLPQTVMHRDIKTSNIMLRNYSWDDHSFEDVVMFDFDLGWYKGAVGEDLTRTDPESLGFQAPEQLQFGKEDARRSTLVDSFGLEITLYYCLSGVTPNIGATEADDWRRRVDGACRRAFGGDAVAGRRCARLILSCTQREQRKRPDSSLIVDDLGDLINWREGSKADCSTEFIAEAIVSLATEGDCEWDEDRQFAFYTFQSGMAIKCAFDPLENQLVLEFQYEYPKNVNRRNLDKRLSELPEFVNKESDRIEAMYCKVIFTASRQIEGVLKWQPNKARDKVQEIGNLAKVIGRWLSAL